MKALGIDETINNATAPIAEVIGQFVFFKISVADAELPLVVLWLIAGAVFFTFYTGFIGIRGFKHALQLVRGDYTDPNSKGEVSHLQALTTAVAGTVGIGNIFGGAFTGEGVAGGVVGTMIIGFQRAVFSNEAGIGSAAIAHSSVKTNEPITEGIVSLLEPFIDTIVICTITALVICVVLGCMVQLGPLLDISDALVFLICVPNILGLYFLAPIVKHELDSYFARLKSGEIKKFI